MKNLRMILMSIMTMFMITNTNVFSQGVEYTFNGVDNIRDLETELNRFDGNNDYGFGYNHFNEVVGGEPISVGDPTITFKIQVSSVGLGKFTVSSKIYSTTLPGTFYNIIKVDGVELQMTGDDGNVINLTEGMTELEFIITNDDLTNDDTQKKVEIESISIQPTTTTGINKNDISNDFNVYKHNNNLIVKTDDYNTQYEVSVHNMNGQMIMSEKNNGQMETYLQVPNGTYIINLITEKGILTKKISVQ